MKEQRLSRIDSLKMRQYQYRERLNHANSYGLPIQEQYQQQIQQQINGQQPQQPRKKLFGIF